MRRKISSEIISYTSIAIVVLVLFFPFVWMLLSSLRSPENLFTSPPTLVFSGLTLKYYKDVFFRSNFLQNALSSTLVALGSTSITLIIATLGAYSLSRFKYRGRKFISETILFVYMFPPILLVIPLFIVMKNLDLTNTYRGLIAVHLIYQFPFAIWLLISFFKAIPIEIEESALIDGCSRLRSFLEVVIPLSAPGVATAALYSFITSWNEYLYAMMFLTQESKKTLPVAIAAYVTRDQIMWGALLSSSVLVSIPAIVFTYFVQKHFVKGLAAGAVKY
ncbi:MAG: carbohydrate ABC transporter permease [Candidatus Aerophobus sp.]|nr:MAG: carbohydrate ABC transporter permease [Candidatus Aerophobus sp.]